MFRFDLLCFIFVVLIWFVWKVSDFGVMVQLDDWVLCRIYNKKGKIEKYNTGAPKSETGVVYNFEHETKPVIEKLRNEQLSTESSDSMQRLQTESSGSGQVVSPDVRWEREVQSHQKWNDIGLQLENAFDFEYNYFDNNNNLSVDDPFGSVEYQMQDVLMEALLMWKWNLLDKGASSCALHGAPLPQNIFIIL